jgi:7,8-dihydropterin-6-yl-methyl-4-(beta-D-ribofuranosyl)aminobenzene 5'-phosphate synthase
MAGSGWVGILVFASLIVGAFDGMGHPSQGRGETEAMESNEKSTDPPALTDLTIRIVHDNCPFDDRLEMAWGFAATVVTPSRTILFDTGSDGTLLLANMAQMEIDPKGIGTVVLSHAHADHTGGLVGFLQTNPAVEVFLLSSFPDRFKQTVRGYGADVIEVNLPREVCVNVHSTGLMGRRIHEQALVVRTEKGLVVLTGCAHPGIDRIVEAVHDSYEGDILLVIGGFHLQWATGSQIERIIRTFERLGVRYVAPTHCTGEKAQQLFEKHFGNRYLQVGVGKTITLADLK